MYCTSPAAYAISGHRSPEMSRATWTRLLTCELRMNRPRARDALTPIISSVLIAEAPPAVGVGIGEPCMTGRAGDEMTFIAAVFGGCESGVRDSGTAACALTAPAAAAPTAAGGGGAWRLWGRRAIWARRS